MTQLIYSALPQPRRSIIYVHSKLSVAQCIDIMTKQNIGALVVREQNKIVGIVSERDIVQSSLHPDFDLHKTTALDVAYVNVSVLDLYDSVEKAMEVITTTKRRHVLVAEDGQLVGILSIGDVLFYLLEDKTRVIEQLENYIHT